MRASSGPRTLVAQGYSLETEPRFTVCFVFFVRSHLQEVSSLSGGAKIASLFTPLSSDIRFLPHLLPAPPFPSLAVGRLRGLTPCTAPESESGLPRFEVCTHKET